MDNYVTQEQCDERRKEIYDKLDDHNIRLTVVETNYNTISAMLKIILGAVVSSGGAILVALLLK